MRTTILLCMLFLSCGFAHSQSFSVGVIGGFSNTDVNGFDTEDGDEDFNRLGVTLGGFVNRSFKDERSSVQMELLFSTKGTYQPADSVNNFVYYRLRLNYLEVPILYKYKMHLLVNKQSLDKLEVEAGPSFAVLTSWSQSSNNIVLPLTRPFNSDDILINIGLIYYFSQNLLLDLRFANSLVPIRSNPGSIANPGYTEFFTNKGEYNTTLNYTFRYTFR